MDAETISKNGASSKSQTSRGNLLRKLYVLLLACIIFSGCVDKDDDLTFTVTFDSKGGSDVTAQTVKKSGTVNKPTDPTRDNYDFAGWAIADDETSPLWDFGTGTVETDMTLYARWDEEDGNNSITVSGTIFGEYATWDEVRVSFDREQTWAITTPIQNEEFSLILPKPDANLFELLTDDIFPEEITVSNNTTKIFEIVIRAFKGSTKSHYPLLLMGESSKGLCMVSWLYADQDVDITGSYTNEEGDRYIYDVKLKKGWNVWLSYESKTFNEYGIWTGKITMNYEIGEIEDIPVGAKWK